MQLVSFIDQIKTKHHADVVEFINAETYEHMAQAYITKRIDKNGTIIVSVFLRSERKDDICENR